MTAEKYNGGGGSIRLPGLQKTGEKVTGTRYYDLKREAI